MKRVKLFYIKERYNPQLGTYYVKMGQLSKEEAKGYNHPLYGDNIMHSFQTSEEYLARIEELIAKGESVQ